MEATFKNARALRLRFSQSLARRLAPVKHHSALPYAHVPAFVADLQCKGGDDRLLWPCTTAMSSECTSMGA
jgi:hypothetical protein